VGKHLAFPRLAGIMSNGGHFARVASSLGGGAVLSIVLAVVVSHFLSEIGWAGLQVADLCIVILDYGTINRTGLAAKTSHLFQKWNVFVYGAWDT